MGTKILLTDSARTAIYTKVNQIADEKQDIISDLSTIRSGAGKGATSVQPTDLADVATSGDYDDLLNKPAIPDAQIQSDWAQADNTKVDYIKNKPAIPIVNDATINFTQGGVAKGSFTLNQASGGTIALDGGSVKTFDLFDHKWSDYQLNDQSWLRADTFSWQDGTVYSDAYNHLVDDLDIEEVQMYAWTYRGSFVYTKSAIPLAGDKIYDVDGTLLTYDVEYDSDGTAITNGYTTFDRDSTADTTIVMIIATQQTETIAGTTITYYLAEDGHKIILPDQENNAVTIYNATGVAWYYILDTTNQRFKLPRELPFDGQAKGNGITLGFTNGTENFGVGSFYGTAGAQATNLYGADVGQTPTRDVTRSAGIGLTTDKTKSGIILNRDNIDSQKYLYFYVGQFSQTATEQTAGLNAELFNGKVDLDLNNMNPSATAKETIVGWGMPDYSAAISATGAYTSNNKFTAPADGILIYGYWSTANSKIYVNDIVVGGLFGTNSGQGLCYPLVMPLSKGDTFYQEYANNTSFPYQNNRFVPFKGVN